MRNTMRKSEPVACLWLLAFLAAGAAPAADWSAANPKYPDELSFSAVCTENIGNVDLAKLNDHTETGIGWNHWPRTFICSLETTAELRLVEVSLPRGSRSTLVKQLQISVDDGSGDFGPAKTVVTYGAYDHYPAKGEPQRNEDCTNHWYSVSGLGRAARVKVRVAGTAWHSVGEIRICGKPVSDAEPSPSAERGKAQAIANSHWSVKVDPFGGRAVSLFSKDVGVEFAAAEGAFTEDCWNVGQSAWYFLNRPFTLTPGGDGRSLAASAGALGSGISFLEIDKTFRLDGRKLHVDYVFKNQPPAMSDQSFSPRVRMRLAAGRGESVYVFPTERGIKEVSSANPPADFLAGDALRGWFAVKGKDGKGVLFRTDEAEVGSLKAVFPKGGAGRVEWSLPTVFVPCGEGHPVAVTLEAFDSLDAVLSEDDRKAVRGKPRRSDPVTNFDYNCYTNFRKTVSRGWAKPMAQGPVKALMLATFCDDVEIGLMAERFDIDFKTTVFAYNGKTLSVGDPKWWIGDYFNQSTKKDFIDSLRRNFESDWQVLVLGGIPFAALPEEVRGIALEKIKKGAGLVTVGQNREDASIGVGAFKNTRALGTPKRLTGDFESVPFELLGRVFATRAEAAGTVHAMLVDTPFLSETKVGEGTHVRLHYTAIGGSNSGPSPRGSFTPPLPGFSPDMVPPTEEYYLLVYKAMLRAIGRKNPFSLRAVKVDGAGAKFAIDLPAEGSTAWEWSVRTAFGEILQEGTCTKRLAKGANEVALDGFAPPRYADRLCLRLAVRTARGKVLDFGEWAFDNASPAALKSLDVKENRKFFDEGDDVEYTARAAGDFSGTRALVELVDSYGRTVASRRVEPGAEMSGSVRIENEIPAKCYELRVTLQDSAGREISRRRAEIRVCPKPEKDPWNDFEPGGWFPDNVREHLWPMFSKICDEEMRYRIVLANHSPMQNDFSTRFGFSTCCLSEAGLWRSPEPEAYSRTGDKMTLVRTPCLSHPDRIAKTIKNTTAAGETSHRNGSRFIWLGDELSLTGYAGQPIDFCFGEHCLAAFRPWLKSRYGTLERLNAEWETDFADWDSVIPFTRQEVWADKSLKHVAGWADHLEFMDGRYTNAQAIAKATILSKDPNALVATSGTQRPSAYGALDWWKQTRVLDGLLSYDEAGSLEVHRSFLDGKRNFLLPWKWGYSLRGPEAVYQLWRTALLGAKGVMGFESTSMISQDFQLSQGAKDALPTIHRLSDGTGMHLINNLGESFEVALLYSQASIRAAFIENRVQEHAANRMKWIELLRNLGCNWRFLSYDELMDGRLESLGFKVLVLADSTALSDREIAAIASFRAKGGIVAAEGVPGRRQWNCRERAKPPFGDLRYWKKTVDAAYLEAVANPLAKESVAEIDRAQGAFRAVLAAAKAEFDGIKVFDAETGRRVAHAKVFPRRDAAGSAFYGVISEDAVARRVRFDFGRKAHVYDLVSGRYLGFADSVEQPLGKAVSHGFQLLPCRLGAPSAAFSGGVLKVELSEPVDAVFHIRVFRPDGTEARAYRRNLPAKGGRAEWKIPFAVSDPAGTWRIEAESVFDGSKASCSASPSIAAGGLK